MRRSISVIMLVLTAGFSSILSPAAGAAASTSFSAAQRPLGQFGIQILDVPVSEAGNPRALSYIIDYLPTGTVIHRRFLIVNEETQAARFSVYPDAAHISGGEFVGYTGETRSELTDWISVQHPVVTLAAEASVKEMITIRVPPGATGGEHYGIIWVQQAARTPKPGRFGVTEIARVGVRLYLAVGQGGAPPTSFDITSITGHRLADGQPVVVAHVNNIGGRAVDLNGSIRLSDGPGSTSSGPFPAQKSVTLAPGQSWDVAFAAPRSLPDGSWRATVRLVSGLTTATAAATVQLGPATAALAGLSAMRWIWLALGGLILVLVLVMGWYALQQRRRRVPS
jgi:hypothetical protein